MREIHSLLNGKATAVKDARSGDVFDPNSGEVQAKVYFGDKSLLDDAVSNALGAQVAWANLRV